MIATPLLYSEKKLAELFGITRDDARYARKMALKKGSDFLDARGAIVLTESGVEKLQAYWQATGMAIEASSVEIAQALIEPPPTPSAEEKNGAEPPPPLPPAASSQVQLRVTRVFPNPRLIEARLESAPSNSRRFQVLVKTNKNFVVNMLFPARPTSPGSTVYELVGQCPRRKGRF